MNLCLRPRKDLQKCIPIHARISRRVWPMWVRFMLLNALQHHRFHIFHEDLWGFISSPTIISLRSMGLEAGPYRKNISMGNTAISWGICWRLNKFRVLSWRSDPLIPFEDNIFTNAPVSTFLLLIRSCAPSYPSKSPLMEIYLLQTLLAITILFDPSGQKYIGCSNHRIVHLISIWLNAFIPQHFVITTFKLSRRCCSDSFISIIILLLFHPIWYS